MIAVHQIREIARTFEFVTARTIHVILKHSMMLACNGASIPGPERGYFEDQIKEKLEDYLQSIE